MMKKYKKTMIITSIIILLPILFGLACWGRLPEEIATHFGSDNTPNGWSSRAFVVFGMPLFMLVLQWVCFAATLNDPKKRNISEKLFTLVLWIVPVISLIMFSMIYLNALGMTMNIGMVANLLLGIVFIVLGNYLPKCKQNYTVGLRIPWTLHSEENWNRTHRLAGWLYMAGGMLFIVNAFLLAEMMLLVIMVLIFVPAIYSFILFKKGV